MRRQKQPNARLSKMARDVQFRQHTTKARSGSALAVVGTQEVTKLTTPWASESPRRQQYCNMGLGSVACVAGIGRLKPAGLAPGAGALLNRAGEQVGLKPGQRVGPPLRNLRVRARAFSKPPSQPS